MTPLTIKDAAQAALDVQDACNGSGVVLSLAKFMPIIREHAGGGTDCTNRHPVFQLFAAKLIELTSMGLSDGDSYREAYACCRLIAEQGE